MSEARAGEPGGALLHPAALAALVVWAFNDHVLKSVWPGSISGKLSDVASQVFFPLLATTCVTLCLPRMSQRSARTILVVFAAATAAVMAAIKLNESAGAVYRWGMGAAQWPFYALHSMAYLAPPPPLQPVALTMDVTDLWTLPAALVPILIGWRRT